jgi:hypothetical protein
MCMDDYTQDSCCLFSLLKICMRFHLRKMKAFTACTKSIRMSCLHNQRQRNYWDSCKQSTLELGSPSCSGDPLIHAICNNWWCQRPDENPQETMIIMNKTTLNLSWKIKVRKIIRSPWVIDNKKQIRKAVSCRKCCAYLTDSKNCPLRRI